MEVRMRRGLVAMIAVAAVAVAAGCGGSSGGGSSSAPSSSGPSSSGGAHTGGTFTILANTSFGVADPAQNYTLQEWQLLINTHDGLVQFKRVGGTPGTQLVPDLATTIPTPTDGGKTYTFQIRKGIKFSNGQVMKPSDFVTTFERQFTVPGPTSFYSGIVGASACKPSHCDLSKGVVADDSAYTLTIHLTAPDPGVPRPAGAAVRLRRAGEHVEEDHRQQRAPRHRPVHVEVVQPEQGSRARPQPVLQGVERRGTARRLPDEIVEKYGLQISDEVTQVERGAADEVFDGDVIPADRLNELNGAQYKNQVHVNPLTADWYMALNTTTPPFNNPKARQAINFAADRNAYVKIGGGSALAQPTCQILPPNFPGYSPYCPYTSGSDTTKWHGTDIAKAKALVKASGTAGMKVVVNSANDETTKALGEQMVSDLNKIGYKASGQYLAGSIQYPYVQNSKNHSKWNVAWSAWYQDYPAPSDFLNVLLGCGSIHPNSDASPNIAAFCDKSIQTQMDQAEAMGTNPTAADAIWQKVDHEVTDQAPWVDLYNPKQIDFLSKRVGNYQWNPQWYILIDQLWVK